LPGLPAWHFPGILLTRYQVFWHSGIRAFWHSSLVVALPALFEEEEDIFSDVPPGRPIQYEFNERDRIIIINMEIPLILLHSSSDPKFHITKY